MKLENVLAEITRDVHNISAKEKNQLEVILKSSNENLDTLFYYLVRTYEADICENKFKVMERVLNYIKTNNPGDYMVALKTAMNKVLQFTHGHRENKIGAFVQTFIAQKKNIEPNQLNEYMGMMVECAASCHAMASIPDADITKSIKETEETVQAMLKEINAHNGPVTQSPVGLEEIAKFAYSLRSMPVPSAKWPLYALQVDAKVALDRLLDLFTGLIHSQPQFQKEVRTGAEIAAEFITIYSNSLISSLSKNPDKLIPVLGEKLNKLLDLRNSKGADKKLEGEAAATTATTITTAVNNRGAAASAPTTATPTETPAVVVTHQFANASNTPLAAKAGVDIAAQKPGAEPLETVTKMNIAKK